MFARNSAALGERLQHLVALALHFEVTRDVVEDEHVAAEEGLAFRFSCIHPLPAQHRCHLHANELIGRASGDEIGHGLRTALPQAVLDVV